MTTKTIDADAEVSAHELTKWLGLSVRRVNDLAERGVLKKVGRGKFLLQESIRRYVENLREVAAGRAAAISGDEGLDLVFQRARVAQQQADKLTRENLLADRKALMVDLAMEVLGKELSRVRTGLLALPRQNAPQLHRCKTPAELEGVLSGLVYEILLELSGAKQIVGKAVAAGAAK